MKQQYSTQLRQFIDLWLLLRNIQLSGEADKISWKWTPDMKCSASSAYMQQFTGSFAAANFQKLWKALVESKYIDSSFGYGFGNASSPTTTF